MTAECRAVGWVNMDEVDVQILGDLAFRDGRYNRVVDRHPRPSGLARRLQLDEKTVRTRLHRMEREGFIKYYQATPSLALWGLEHLGLFRVEAVTLATKQAALTWIGEQPMALEAFDFLGSSLVASFVGPDAASLSAAAARFAGRFEMTCHPLGTRALPPAPMALDRIDWRIVRALRYDARRTTRSLAEAAGITARMAEYRLARLVNSGAVAVRAVLDSQRQQGLVFYELELNLEPGHAGSVLQSIRTRHARRFWSVHQPSKETLIVNLFGFTLAEPEAAALEVLALKGVLRASVYVQKESVEPRRPSWIDRRIDSEVGEGDRPLRPKPRPRLRRS